MYLTPREQEKLLVTVAADLARRRRDRGLKLNYPEAVVLIASELMEGARDGRSVADLMGYGKTILGRADVMDGVAEMIPEVQVEATFPDRALRFSRAEARGYRLDIPAGTSVRFEPGEERSVQLVALAGRRVVHGLNGLVNGPLDTHGR